jgi:hypothetical protein
MQVAIDLNSVACINEVQNAHRILKDESVKEQPLGDQGGDTIILMLRLSMLCGVAMK